MSGIVCALRGGPGSHHTRRAGLERSTDASTPLYLLVVIPDGSYEALHDGEQHAIRAEMAWRELALARATAAHLGQPDAQFNIQIRIGELRAVIAEFVVSVEADTLLLGTPRMATDAALSVADLESLAAQFRRQLGVEVEVVRPGTLTEASAVPGH